MQLIMLTSRPDTLGVFCSSYDMTSMTVMRIVQTVIEPHL